MKICPKCNDFTYDDITEKCPKCKTKLQQVEPNSVMGVDQKSYLNTKELDSK